tara:strand:+ start:84 stop:278 length:195 start_codon:yes stop_codon:yes gene_type:complete
MHIMKILTRRVLFSVQFMGLVNPGFDIALEDNTIVDALKLFIPDNEVLPLRFRHPSPRRRRANH